LSTRKIRPRRSGAAHAAWIALVLLAGTVGGLHELFEPHAVCAEHGELVERPGAAGAADEHGAQDPASGPRVAKSDPRSSAHEHCPFALLGRSTTSPFEGLRLVVLGAPPEAAGAEASAEPARSIPLLSLAPKHSPPGLA